MFIVIVIFNISTSSKFPMLYDTEVALQFPLACISIKTSVKILSHIS